jgi:hypothetical protein
MGCLAEWPASIWIARSLFLHSISSNRIHDVMTKAEGLHLGDLLEVWVAILGGVL